MSKLNDLIKELCPNGVEYKKLGDVCNIKTGELINKKYIQAHPGEYPVVNSGKEPLGYVDTYNVDDDPIGIASRGQLARLLIVGGGIFVVI